jgi:hypothetical protein
LKEKKSLHHLGLNITKPSWHAPIHQVLIFNGAKSVVGCHDLEDLNIIKKQNIQNKQQPSLIVRLDMLNSRALQMNGECFGTVAS